MFNRFIQHAVDTALNDTPVVVVNGPRQSGKTTFVKMLREDWEYLTFDDETLIQAAIFDPQGFVNELPEHVILDEVQRVPELFRAIKLSVDNNRKPGRFLMTGSANVLTLPKLSDSLAGRLEAIPLYPLSLCELENQPLSFLEKILTDKLGQPTQGKLGQALIDILLTGGYPEAVARESFSRKQRWYQQYLNTLIQRDVQELSNIHHLDQLPKLLTTLANHSGQLLEKSSLASITGVSRTTVIRMIQLLENVFLLHELPAWHSNRHKRLAKMPKVHLTDTGLLCSLLKLSNSEAQKDRRLIGHLTETFVFNELLKQASWLEDSVEFFHYRDHDKREVDLILQIKNDLIAVEVKVAESVNAKDFQGIDAFAKKAPNRFRLGIVLYDGDRIVPFGEQKLAVPIACLWS